MTAREVMNRPRREGWTERSGKGSHRKFTKSGYPSVIVPDHRGDLNAACFTRSAVPPVGNGRRSDEGMTIAEPDDAGGYWISFPGRDGIGSAATSADQIVPQARDALEAVATDEDDGDLPLSIEDGAMPPADLTGYDNPLVVMIPFEVTARAAAG